MAVSFRAALWLPALIAGATAAGQSTLANLPGRTTFNVVDSRSGRPLAARVYIQDAGGQFHFVQPARGQGVRYDKQNWINSAAVERHVTVPVGACYADLPAGNYTVTVERGKEYRPAVQTFQVTDRLASLVLKLDRWIDMARLGWFSGDVHVHRTLDELPLLQEAEDLNVAFPLTYWVTRAFDPPARGDKNTSAGSAEGPVRVDATHVTWPQNTEWEIFTVGPTRHTLGALFALGHRGALTTGTPPVRAARDEARKAGALLDLDKHDWPWALALVPLADVDLYELANNHVWRTEFGFTTWNSPAPAYMGLPNEGKSGGERDWLEYTHRTYWTLLNSGFRLRPSAGTASGVHPVPPGFGRVYVHTPEGFTYDRWRAGLNEGRSFVTTGPMPVVQVAGRTAGGTVHRVPGERTPVEITGVIHSEEPLESIELIVNGTAGKVRFESRPGRAGSREARFRASVEVESTTWVAVRCWEPREGGRRVRFAHTAPTWIEVSERPLLPRRPEVEFLMRRVQEQIDRSSGVLPEVAIQEYRRALAVYAARLKLAR